MLLKIESFRTSDKEKFESIKEVRRIVFIEEQKVEERDEFDEFEDECIHYQLIVNNRVVGTARWRMVGEKVKLERFAVLKEYRGKKYGDALLEKVIKDASNEKKPMYLHAQLKAVPFYQRRGFKKVGDIFMECDIEHYAMELR